MVSRFCVLLLTSAVLFGCGGESSAPGGGKSGDASTAKTIPFPEKALADFKGSLASGSKLTGQNVDSYIKYMKGLVELQKGASADPMAMATKMQNLPKDCGFKDDADMKDRMQQVATGMQLLFVMAATEASPAAGQLNPGFTKAVAESKKLAVETGLSEADLRLIHGRLKDLQSVGAGQ